jgi:hypothetical protein
MNKTAAQAKRGPIDGRGVVWFRHRASAETFLQKVPPQFHGRMTRVESRCWCVLWERMAP